MPLITARAASAWRCQVPLPVSAPPSSSQATAMPNPLCSPNGSRAPNRPLACGTTTTRTADGRSYTVGSEGVTVKQGVAGVSPTEVIVENARTAVWGPARVYTDGNTTTTIHEIYVNVPDTVTADANFNRYQRLK